jgi:hypothetical protein
MPKPVSKVGGDLGLCAGQSFPPYLGRIVPTSTGVSKSLGGSRGNPIDATNVTWEIREPYASAAIRWVVRGLIKSGHLAEIEAMDGKYVPNSNTYDERSGAVIANNAYYKEDSATPFEVLDIKDMLRKKKAEMKGEEEESSEEEVELSEYEQMRAARVARNQERFVELEFSVLGIDYFRFVFIHNSHTLHLLLLLSHPFFQAQDAWACLAM